MSELIEDEGTKTCTWKFPNDGYESDDWELHSILSYRPPQGFPSSFFKVETNESDALFLKRFGRKGPRNQQPDCRFKRPRMAKFKETLTKVLLEQDCLSTWNIYRHFAQTPGMDALYKEAIVAAAKFVCLLVSKDGIYDYTTESLLGKQMNELWKFVSNMGKRGHSFVKVWKKSVCQLRNNKSDKYSLVTETHLAGLVYDYHTAPWPKKFDEPYFRTSSRMSYNRFTRIIKDSIYTDINNEIRDIDFFPSLGADDHTCLLVMVAREKISEVVKMFIPRLLKETEVQPKLPNNFLFTGQLEEVTILFENLARLFKREISEELLDLINPFSIKPMVGDVVASAAVCEVMEVAELRRRALGRRFIGRDLFVWSFYKCGYGLPPQVCDGLVLNTGGEDHPLSQIYNDVVKLIESLGVEMIELEHFVFVLLYPDEIDGDVKYPAGSYLQLFTDFMEDVDADMKVRPRVTTQDEFLDYFVDGLFKLKLTKLKPKLTVT